MFLFISGLIIGVFLGITIMCILTITGDDE